MYNKYIHIQKSTIVFFLFSLKTKKTLKILKKKEEEIYIYIL